MLNQLFILTCYVVTIAKGASQITSQKECSTCRSNEKTACRLTYNDDQAFCCSDFELRHGECSNKETYCSRRTD